MATSFRVIRLQCDRYQVSADEGDLSVEREPGGMRKAFLFAALLLTPGWCDAPGITFVNGTLYREDPDPAYDSGLRGNMTIRNDFGAELKQVRVVIHVMDGYGRPIFDIPNPPIARMQAGQSETIGIYRGSYNGTVALFQLGADIDAESAAGPQHFALAPRDAAAGIPGVKGY